MGIPRTFQLLCGATKFTWSCGRAIASLNGHTLSQGKVQWSAVGVHLVVREGKAARRERNATYRGNAMIVLFRVIFNGVGKLSDYNVYYRRFGLNKVYRSN